MDFSSKAVKPAPNIFEFVHRFAKVCRLKSIGLVSGENPDVVQSMGDGSEGTEETECGIYEQKIYPQPIEETQFKAHEDISTASETLRKLFASISSLKTAYIQLQEAHTPYDLIKIQLADQLVVSELKSLSEVKHSYREKQNTKPMLDSNSNSSSASSSLLSASDASVEIQHYQRLLEELLTQIESKDAEILQLQNKLDELNGQNAEFEERIERSEEQNITLSRDSNLDSFQEVFQMASKSIHDFAKPLIALMKASDWDLDQAACAIEDAVMYLKRSDKKYAFEAYICRKMFGTGGWPQSSNFNGVTRHQDPFDALVVHQDSEFAKFCREKYLLVVHSVMEQSFFGNLDQRAFVLSGRHPRTPLYQAFVKMAKWVWLLMGMARKMDPAAEIFRVQKGSKFSEAYMENVVEGVQGRGMEVGLMVMPGFRIGEKVIRCRVYLSLIN